MTSPAVKPEDRLRLEPDRLIRLAFFTSTVTRLVFPRESVTWTVMVRVPPEELVRSTVPFSSVAEEEVAVISMEMTWSPLVTRPTV